MQNILRYRIFIFAASLVFWSFYIDSPFRKDGVSIETHYAIVLVTIILSFIHVLPNKNLVLLEKFIYGLLASAAGILMGYALCGEVLESIYGEYEISVNPFHTNLIFYSLINITSLGVLSLFMFYQARKLRIS